MYSIKLKRTGHRDENFECDHYAVESVSEASPAADPDVMGEHVKQPGIIIELSKIINNRLRIFHTISLPDHGEEVFVTNSTGVTTDHHKWPMR